MSILPDQTQPDEALRRARAADQPSAEQSGGDQIAAEYAHRYDGEYGPVWMVAEVAR